MKTRTIMRCGGDAAAERAPTAGVGRRQWLARAAGLAGALTLGGCAGRGPLRVGFLGGLSGRMSDLGIGGRNGVQMAVDDLNAAGGVDRRSVELLARDDEQDDDVARRRLTELYDAGVVAVVGPMTSSIAAALLPLANQRRIPLVSPLAGANELSGRDDAFFRVVSDAASSARQQADALRARRLGRVLPVADVRNAVFSRGWTSALSARFAQRGGVALPTLEFEAAPGLRFVELAQRIAASGADAVAVAASAADSAVLVQQLRRLRDDVFVTLSAWAGTEELPQLGGQALEGVLVGQFFDRSSTRPRWLDFAARYRQRFGAAPGYQAMNGYDAMRLTATGLAQAGADGAVAALRRVRSFEGLQRVLTFDEFGDCLLSTSLAEIRDGRYVTVQG